MKKYLILILALSWTSSISAQSSDVISDDAALKFAEDQYAKMSLEEKIGQLFMVAAYSGGKKYDDAGIQSLIRNYHIGGLIFMQGTAENQIRLTNKYQSMTKTPLLIGMDAEWGVGMRLTGVKDLAKNIQLGATNDTHLAYDVGKVIAEQCKRLGVHINFGPVVDINNNPDNPVINFRSFGEDKNIVSRLGMSYAQGQEQSGVMACTKHFPGHGDTDVDSHKDLPTISKSIEVLWNNELYPFRMLKDEASATMIAHLTVPAITQSQKLPTTLSYDCVTTLLKGRMGYQGLVFTDALNMQAVAKYYDIGEVDYKAFMAGNDVLLFSQSVPKAVAMIKKGVKSGAISESRLKSSVIKILRAKYNFGAYNHEIMTRGSVHASTLNVSGATSELNKNIQTLNAKIAAKSITLCKDEKGLMSNRQPGRKILYAALGQVTNPGVLSRYSNIKTVYLKSGLTQSQMKSYLNQWSAYDLVIIGIHGVHKYPTGNYGLSSSLISTANFLANNGTNTALLINGNPYAAKYFCDAHTLIVSYQETDYNLSATLDIVQGQGSFAGRLPVSVCAQLPVGSGLVTNVSAPIKPPRSMYKPRSGGIQNTQTQLHKINKIMQSDAGTGLYMGVPNRKDSTRKTISEATRLARLKYLEKTGKDIPLEAAKTEVIPEPAQEPIPATKKEELKKPIKMYNFSEVDKMVQSYINRGVFPGCQILVAKNGRVVHYKSYGHHTYVGMQTVKNTDVYDIASVTKIASTTLAVMKLYEEGKIQLDDILGKYLPMVQGTDKQNLTIRRLLLHEAGLVAWIPFYKECMTEDNKYKPGTLVNYKSPAYPIPVANNLYINKDYPDTMWAEILNSSVGGRKYKYSDLDFLFLQKVVEAVSGMPLDEYVAQNFYKPLGLTRIGYNPKVSHWISKTALVPTERDDYFRMQLVDGYVHDQCAAMLGGVAGHAGLFSDGSSLFVILQMLLNGGEFSGKRYLKQSTIDLFTKRGSSISRRGLGFDKPETRKPGGPTGDKCSPATFGHQGFTGTCVWADPKDDVVFIFLSNRVYPTAENRLIGRLDVRTKLQDECYRIMGL